MRPHTTGPLRATCLLLAAYLAAGTAGGAPEWVKPSGPAVALADWFRCSAPLRGRIANVNLNYDGSLAVFLLTGERRVCLAKTAGLNMYNRQGIKCSTPLPDGMEPSWMRFSWEYQKAVFKVTSRSDSTKSGFCFWDPMAAKDGTRDGLKCFHQGKYSDFRKYKPGPIDIAAINGNQIAWSFSGAICFGSLATLTGDPSADDASVMQCWVGDSASGLNRLRTGPIKLSDDGSTLAFSTSEGKACVLKKADVVDGTPAGIKCSMSKKVIHTVTPSISMDGKVIVWPAKGGVCVGKTMAMIDGSSTGIICPRKVGRRSPPRVPHATPFVTRDGLMFMYSDSNNDELCWGQVNYAEEGMATRMTCSGNAPGYGHVGRVSVKGNGATAVYGTGHEMCVNAIGDIVEGSAAGHSCRAIRGLGGDQMTTTTQPAISDMGKVIAFGRTNAFNAEEKWSRICIGDAQNSPEPPPPDWTPPPGPKDTDVALPPWTVCSGDFGSRLIFEHVVMDQADKWAAFSLEDHKKLCVMRLSQTRQGTMRGIKCTAPLGAIPRRLVWSPKLNSVLYNGGGKLCVANPSEMMEGTMAGVKCIARTGTGIADRISGGKFSIDGEGKRIAWNSGNKYFCVAEFAMMREGTMDGVKCANPMWQAGPAVISKDGSTISMGVASRKIACMAIVDQMEDMTTKGMYCSKERTTANPDEPMIKYHLNPAVSADGGVTLWSTEEYFTCIGWKKMRIEPGTPGGIGELPLKCIQGPTARGQAVTTAVFVSEDGEMGGTTDPNNDQVCYASLRKVTHGTMDGTKCTSALGSVASASWDAKGRLFASTQNFQLCAFSLAELEDNAAAGFVCRSITHLPPTGSSPAGLGGMGTRVSFGRYTWGTGACSGDSCHGSICWASTVKDEEAPPNALPLPEEEKDEPEPLACEDIESCDKCSSIRARKSGCRWCATSKMCMHKDEDDYAECPERGCDVRFCGEPAERARQCKASNTKWKKGHCHCAFGQTCVNRRCVEQATCDETVRPGQKCAKNAMRDMDGITLESGQTLIEVETTCKCRKTSADCNNGRCSTPAADKFADAISNPGTEVELTEGEGVVVESNLAMAANSRMKFGDGTADASSSMIKETPGESTVSVSEMIMELVAFQMKRVKCLMEKLQIKKDMEWEDCNVVVSQDMTIEGSTLFSKSDDPDADSAIVEIGASATLETGKDADTSFECKFKSAAGSLSKFKGDVEMTGEVDMDGTQQIRNCRIASDNAMIKGTVEGVDSDPDAKIIFEGGMVDLQAGSEVKVKVETERLEKDPLEEVSTARNHRRRRVEAQAIHDTGYGTTLTTAGIVGSLNLQDVFWVPKLTATFNGDIHLAHDSLLYIGDEWTSPGQFISINGGLTLDANIIELDYGDSTTANNDAAAHNMDHKIAEADYINGIAFITVVSDESDGSTMAWSLEKVEVAGRVELWARLKDPAVWMDPTTVTRSALFAVAVDGAAAYTPASFETTIKPEVMAQWTRNAAAWAAMPFTMKVHGINNTVGLPAPYPVFSFEAPKMLHSDIEQFFGAFFRARGAAFSVLSYLEKKSMPFQCGVADAPEAGESVWVCAPQFFAGSTTCGPQTLTDATCGAAREENCNADPMGSPHCFEFIA